MPAIKRRSRGVAAALRLSPAKLLCADRLRGKTPSLWQARATFPTVPIVIDSPYSSGLCKAPSKLHKQVEEQYSIEYEQN
jgi:hypothetical protein